MLSISSSAGELEPVFQAMLENAIRLCEAKFGTLLLCEGDALRMVAMHNVPPAFAEKRRHEPVIRPHPETGLARTVRTKQVVQIAVMIVFGEAHLVGSLGQYAAYYNESRIHRSLNKDAPYPRAIERLGVIKSRPVLGGLHHQYCRI